MLGIALMALAFGQNAPAEQSLVVATKKFEPFVFDEEADARPGFSIDLWAAVADEMGVTYEFSRTDSVSALLNTVTGTAPTADVAIAAITITAAREEAVDFTLPFYEGGLQILVPRAAGGQRWDFWRILVAPEVIQVTLILLLFIAVTAHLIWLAERNRNSDMFPRTYLRGVGEGVWWAAVTVTTVGYGDRVPRTWPGRLVSGVWMFCGLILISFFTATITTSLTVEALDTDISGPSALDGRRVAAPAGTTAAVWLARRSVKLMETSDIREAYQFLEDGKVDAVVYDSAALQFYATHEGAHSFMVVGPIFEPQSYGIAVPKNSPLREQISRALLEVRESGKYELIKARYFGSIE